MPLVIDPPMTDPRRSSQAPVWGPGVERTAPTSAPPTGAPPPRYEPDASAPTTVAIVVVSVVVIAAMLVGLAVWRFSGEATGDEVTEEETAGSTVPRDDPGRTPPSTSPGGTAVPLPTVPPSTTTPPAPLAVDPELADTIEEIQGFVERQRGLDYLADVTVEVVEATTYDARIRALLEARREVIDDDGKVWQALGLVDPGVPFFEVVWTTEITRSSVRYDPAANVLLVEDGELDAYRRAELVGQLTVALDDQHTELDRPDLDALPDESALAFRSLWAGDAERVVGLWRQAIDSDEEVEIIDRERELTAEVAKYGIPDKVLVYVTAPGTLGSILAEELYFSDGAMLDAAFADPPVTTEQLIHPSAYEDGEGAIEVAPPPADGEVFDEGIFGEYLLIVTLTDILGSDHAYDVGDGWGGDWFVAWTQGADEAPCVRVDLTGDDAGETDEIEAGLLDWAEEAGATVERPADDVVRFTMCAASGGGAASRL